MNRKLKVGDWVVIQENRYKQSWYHRKPMKILRKDGNLLIVDYDFNSEFPDRADNYIQIGLVEYYPMRELKLERILEED